MSNIKPSGGVEVKLRVLHTYYVPLCSPWSAPACRIPVVKTPCVQVLTGTSVALRGGFCHASGMGWDESIELSGVVAL